ncbi:hypothetical protein CYLTODRAFT_415080 [Cylindrobasidium torrendii FP15055 ss-10]|uniref:Velvet domain-containing protein n=1 Tax=Cylindrobasidium torrendii FP15055 ss-10 TaxID=1314674 RepID=A0A0D7AVB7_9AGAR|nr:hypothetical protein CYLTODRAFT_415080 [Cylindrobasidium torrendii FP15055 ss-10]
MPPLQGSKIDARPIDPPPVVQIQFFEVNPNDGSEVEILNYSYTSWMAQTALLRYSEEQALYLLPPECMPVYASQECTTALMHGEIFGSVMPLNWEDREILVCPFRFLSVREEGIFVLSFRTFDIGRSTTMDGQSGISAMAWSNIFRVFPTRSTPLLAPSTPLTNALAEFTGAVRARVTQRATTSKKRKQPVSEEQ